MARKTVRRKKAVKKRVVRKKTTARKKTVKRKAVTRKATRKKKTVKRKEVKRKVTRKKAVKKTVRKKAAKKVVKRKVKRKGTKRVPSAKFMAPLKVSSALEEIVGKGPLPRTEVTKKLWVYIKKHKLQDPQNRRNIVPDAKLAKVFGKKSAVSMFQMTKLVSKHLG